MTISAGVSNVAQNVANSAQNVANKAKSFDFNKVLAKGVGVAGLGAVL